MAKKTESELLKLLNSRKAWELPPYQRPVFNPTIIHFVARSYAQVESSDPFAYGRMMLYLERGYELPSDVAKESTLRAKVLAHQATQFQALAKLKREMDETRAWNQHKSKMYKEAA